MNKAVIDVTTRIEPTTGRALRPEGAAGEVWDLLDSVPDPEIPVLTIADLGILRGVEVGEDGRNTVVTITPTYSGCPAMETITSDIHRVLAGAGHTEVQVRTSLQPAWTTDWMTAEGKAKLEQFGIAPPSGKAPAPGEPVALTLSVRCPQCGSFRTREMTRFGSTSCKALWTCQDCSEPFDHFKVH